MLEGSALAALLSMLLAFIATQSIGHRLMRITDFAERVAAGDLSARIEEESSDEIAHENSWFPASPRAAPSTARGGVSLPGHQFARGAFTLDTAPHGFSLQ